MSSKVLRFFFLFTLLFFILPLLTSQSYKNIKMVSQSSAQLGEVLTAVLQNPNSDEEYNFILRDSEGVAKVKVPAFFYSLGEYGTVVVALIPIYPLWEEGSYTIEARNTKENPKFYLEKKVELVPFDFEESVIHIPSFGGSSSSAAARARAQKKREQALRRINILNEFNSHYPPYHTDTLIFPLASDDGYWETSAFGDRRLYKYSSGHTTISAHFGWDFGSPQGTSVYAPGYGKVVLSEDRIVTGKTVIIEHLPGLFSQIQHLSKLSIEEGQFVRTGDLIGEVGTTGEFSTAPHLHWEMQLHFTPVSPRYFLTNPILDTKKIVALIKKGEKSSASKPIPLPSVE